MKFKPSNFRPHKMVRPAAVKPFCLMETLGGWHEATEMQVKKLASAQARQTGEDQSDATRHLYQKLAVLLAKGSAA